MDAPLEIIHIAPRPDCKIILKDPLKQLWPPSASLFSGKPINGKDWGDSSDDDSSIKEEVYYHVSSVHLQAASPVFDTMLSPRFKEGELNPIDGLYHIVASDWDKEAFRILLNALHLRSHAIPRIITLEMLTKIAIIVDYYKCYEAIQLCSEMWIRHLEAAVPIMSAYTQDVDMWMFVAWVFRLPEKFVITTKIAINGSFPDRLPINILPITPFSGKVT